MNVLYSLAYFERQQLFLKFSFQISISMETQIDASEHVLRSSPVLPHTKNLAPDLPISQSTTPAVNWWTNTSSKFFAIKTKLRSKIFGVKLYLYLQVRCSPYTLAKQKYQ